MTGRYQCSLHPPSLYPICSSCLPVYYYPPALSSALLHSLLLQFFVSVHLFLCLPSFSGCQLYAEAGLCFSPVNRVAFSFHLYSGLPYFPLNLLCLAALLLYFLPNRSLPFFH